MKLSDSFNTKLKEKGLEFQTIVLNVNYGQNKTIMRRCKRLNDYSIFIDRVRYYVAQDNNLEESIKQAIGECIKQNVLSDISDGSSISHLIMLRKDAQGFGYVLCQRRLTRIPCQDSKTSLE